MGDFLAVDNFDFTRKIVKKKFGRKNHENVVVLDFLAVDNFDFPRKIVKKKIGGKTRENVVVLDLLAVDNFDFTRKIVKKIGGEKLVKMFWFWAFLLLTTLISRGKLSKIFWVKNSRKCWRFV